MRPGGGSQAQPVPRGSCQGKGAAGRARGPWGCRGAWLCQPRWQLLLSHLSALERGQGAAKAQVGTGEAVPWGSDCGHPWSEPAAGPEWVGTSGRAPWGLRGTCKSQSRAENCPSPPGHAARGARGVPGLLPCSLGPAQGSLGRAVLAIPVHPGRSPLPEP